MIAFQIGTLPVYSFGLILASAALAALILMVFTGKKEGLKSGTVSWFAVWVIPLAVLCARIGYCLTSLDWIMEQGFSFFLAFTRGGYMLYGAVLGGLLAAWIAGRCSHENPVRILDSAAAPASLLIIVGRLAEPLVGLGYGHNIEEWFDPWAEKSMVAWEDPSLLYRYPLGTEDYYGDWNFGIFLPEALTALVLLVVLLCLRPRKSGGKTLLLLTGYASGQIIWESMRQDEVLRWGFVRASQLLSAVTLVIVLIICWKNLSAPHRKISGLICRLSGMVLLCGVIIAMEFALEQKISFLTWMRMDLCYIVMALCCAGFLGILLPVWKKAFPPMHEAET